MNGKSSNSNANEKFWMSSRNKVISLIITIIIIFSVIIGSNYHFESQVHTPNGEDPNNITGYIELNGVTKTVKSPITVQQGGTLRLIDCHLRVLLEDLIFWNQSAFTIEHGGALDIESSRVEIVMHRNLNNALYSSKDNDIFHRPPYLTRVVNLADATDPILSFDVSWRGDAPRLVVMGQESNISELELLDWFAYEGTSYGEWHHHEVSLGELGDEVVGVAISPITNSMDAIFISNIFITDSGRELKGDYFPTGNAIKDGWDMDSGIVFQSFQTILKRYSKWPGLIHCSGETTVRDSEIVASANLSRWIEFDIVDDDEYILTKSGHISNHQIASKGGHIEMNGDRFIVEDSRVSYVPILASTTDITILNSTIEGNADQVTLSRCSGIIAGTDITSDNIGQNQPFHYENTFEGQYLWDLSVEGTFEDKSLEISDCHLIGSDVALDLDNSRISLTDCEFHRFKQLAIWDHESSGIGEWTALNKSCKFADGGGPVYIRTQTCQVEFDGANKPTNRSLYDGGWGWFDSYPMGLLREINLLDVYWGGATILLPTFFVDKNRTPIEIVKITVILGTYWGGWERIDVSSGSRTEQLWFTGKNLEYSETYWNEETDLVHALGMEFDEGGKAGELLLNISVYPWSLNELGLNRSLQVEVFLDEVAIGRFNVSSDGIFIEYAYHLNKLIPIQPGLNNLRLKLWGLPEGEENVTLYQNVTEEIYRITQSASSAIVREYIRNPSGPLIIDPGVVLDISGFSPIRYYEESYSFWSLSIITFNESRISLHGSEDEVPDFLEISKKGFGNLQLEGFVCKYFDFDVQSGSVSLANLTITNGILMYGSKEADITIDRCDVSFNPWDQYSAVENSSVSIRNSTFKSPEPMRYTLELKLEGTLEVIDCEFVNVTFGPGPWYYRSFNVSIFISGCTFRGRSAFCALSNPHYFPDIIFPKVFSNGTLNGMVEGNCFLGDGTGIVGNIEQIRLMVGDNQYEQGAKVLAHYEIPLSDPDQYIPYRWYVVYMDDARGLDMAFMGRFYDPEYDHIGFIDVIDNPTQAAKPQTVWAMIRDNTWKGEVISFALVDTTLGFNISKVPSRWGLINSWTHLNSAIHELMEHLDEDEDKWWEND
jgi:hypothetical protein